MEITPDAEDRIIRYLLGDLPAAESLEIEKAYFSDDEYFESIQGLEAELLRNFVTDRMPPDLRRRFSKHYQSSPDLLKKLEFARASAAASINLRAAESPSGNRVGIVRSIVSVFGFRFPAFQFAMASVAVVAAVVVMFFWRQNTRLKVEVAQLERTNHSLAEQRSPVDQTRPAKPTEVPILASFVLMPGISRDQGQVKSIVVPKGQGVIEFKLPLPSGVAYLAYRAILEKQPNDQISSRDLPVDAVVDSGHALIDHIPSAGLTPGRYILYVNGKNERGEFEDVQYYVFAVKN